VGWDKFRQISASSPAEITGEAFSSHHAIPVITPKGLERIEAHLDQILLHQNVPKELQIGERTMLSRLRSGNRTSQDIEFYLHELKESAMFRQTGNLSFSHEHAL
jgi:antitoxin component HigA of HigAB toxin-antitoxin module